MRVAAVAVLSLPFLLGCAGGGPLPPDTEVNTPFGSIERGRGADAVEQRMERSRIKGIDLDDAARRMATVENCILRRQSMGIDHCSCYAEAEVMPGGECIPEPGEKRTPAGETVPTGLREPPPAGVDRGGSGGGADAPSLSALRDAIKAAEGGPKLAAENGHVCWGHWITPEEEESGRFGSRRLSLGECEMVLDEDIAEARSEARRVFGLEDDGRVELCFLAPCARWFGQTPAGDLAEAVRSDRERKPHGVRETRVAAAIERGSP